MSGLKPRPPKEKTGNDKPKSGAPPSYGGRAGGERPRPKSTDRSVCATKPGETEEPAGCRRYKGGARSGVGGPPQKADRTRAGTQDGGINPPLQRQDGRQHQNAGPSRFLSQLGASRVSRERGLAWLKPGAYKGGIVRTWGPAVLDPI